MWSQSLREFGPATKVSHRRSVARQPFDPKIRRLAREALRYPVVEFDDAQIAAIGRGVTREIERYNAAAMYAFAQLPDHFHFVCGRCRYDIRRFEGRIKGAATRQLLEEGIHPLSEFRDERGDVPTPWSAKPWVVYLFSDEDMVRSIDYVRQNLVRARMKPQEYSFVVPYVCAGARGAEARGAADRV